MMVRVDTCCVVREVNSYHHLILTLLGTSWSLVAICGTSWHILVVRVDMGTSWHLLCGNGCLLVPSSDTCIFGYGLTSNGGTSWHHLWYELTSIGGTSWHGYELTWVRVDRYSVGIYGVNMWFLWLTLLIKLNYIGKTIFSKEDYKKGNIKH